MFSRGNEMDKKAKIQQDIL